MLFALLLLFKTAAVAIVVGAKGLRLTQAEQGIHLRAYRCPYGLTIATLPTLLAPVWSSARCVGSVDPFADYVLAALMEAHEAGLAEVF